jgi:predicted transcriptional regulator of viral defense system
MRLKDKHRVNHVRGDLWVIVPHEYASWGVLPASWFIDKLMDYLKTPYYIGLLSAAALYAAAHQQPQQFQVMVPEPVRPIIKGKEGRVSIKFFKSSLVSKVPTQKVQTETGYMNVSTPEVTALDLVKFYRKAGHLSNVATVLSELKEKLKIKEFIKVAIPDLYEWPILQRLGYLLSLEGVDGKEFAAPIQELISQHLPRFVPLVNQQGYENSKKDVNWRLYINEEVELDI